MTWETDEQRLCTMIRDRRLAASAENDDFAAFQGFAAAAQAFGASGIIESVRPTKESMTGRDHVMHASWKVPASVASAGLSTVQRRWLLLRFFATQSRLNDYDLFSPAASSFAGLAGSDGQLTQACQWLSDQDFITWTTSLDGGYGRITDKGEKALEHGIGALTSRNGGAVPVQHVDSRDQSITIHTLNSAGGDVVVGPNATLNKEALAAELQLLVQAIQQGPGSPAEKQSAIGGLKGFLAHPLVAAIVGGLFGGIG